MKVIHNKLIRDNIPEIIERDNKTYKVRVLDDAEYLACLKDKLLEEGNEVKNAGDRSEVIKEIADVLEVLDAIKGCYGITDEEVMTVKNKKVSSNGAFNKRLFLEYVEKKDVQ